MGGHSENKYICFEGVWEGRVKRGIKDSGGAGGRGYMCGKIIKSLEAGIDTKYI